MSYNLKNKMLVMMATSFAVIMMANRASQAQALEAPSVISPQPQAAAAQDNSAQVDKDALNFLDEKPAESPNAERKRPQQKSLPENAKSETAKSETAKVDPKNPVNLEQIDKLIDSVEAIAGEEEKAETEAEKSPFEKFGNAILSKVDSDLFNQMAKIEKQTTLLNLELKREDLKNRVEALRAARIRAQNEEKLRMLEEEEKIKDMENKRQAALLVEKQKLKEKEIELEKVRQAKVLNDYMNEMLIKNQQWIEKNAKLQTRIRDLEAERKEVIADFHAKTDEIKAELAIIQQQADSAVSTHLRRVADLENKIERLQQSLLDSENKLKKAQSGDNPFGDSLNVDASAVDMSQEYAIMDITGKGEDIVAKIVSKDGTTFLVHKGSMLKGGEVVTSITDHYIAFDNKGIKSFLYTGGTVLDFEPTKTFNGSDRTPEVTEKASFKTSEGLENRAETTNVKPASQNQTAKNQEVSASQSRRNSKRQRTSHKNNAEAPVSFSQGMFVK